MTGSRNAPAPDLPTVRLMARLPSCPPSHDECILLDTSGLVRLGVYALVQPAPRLATILVSRAATLGGRSCTVAPSADGRSDVV